MAPFNIYLRSTAATKIFRIAGDHRFLSSDEVTIDLDQESQIRGRTLHSLIKQLHERGHLRIKTVPEQTPIASAIGGALFSSVIRASQATSDRFDEYHKKCLANYRKLRLSLHLPPSLYHLPWELLRDPSDAPGNFIALNGSITRYDMDIPEKNFEPAQLPFKLWFMFANPSNRPFGGDVEFLPPPHNGIQFDHITPATFERFQDTLRNYMFVTSKPRVQPLVFAFFGHGDIDDKKIGQLVFVKQGDRKGFTRPWVSDPRPSWAINDTIVSCPHLRVAFLCACESAWAATAADFENSIAGNLLRGSPSLGYVIGAQTPIDRFSADIFLAEILKKLPTTPLDLAISDARAAVRGMNYNDAGQEFSGLDWWVPVLYARAAGFDVVARADIQPDLQSPPPVLNRAVVGMDSTSDERVSTGAMLSDMARRLTALLSPR